uniref:Uncharacterized protein n=1 Tax=Salix viminalis TaxID=40686 RepID=A0A6N2KUU6_SALVM
MQHNDFRDELYPLYNLKDTMRYENQWNEISSKFGLPSEVYLPPFFHSSVYHHHRHCPHLCRLQNGSTAPIHFQLIS